MAEMKKTNNDLDYAKSIAELNKELDDALLRQKALQAVMKATADEADKDVKKTKEKAEQEKIIYGQRQAFFELVQRENEASEKSLNLEVETSKYLNQKLKLEARLLENEDNKADTEKKLKLLLQEGQNMAKEEKLLKAKEKDRKLQLEIAKALAKSGTTDPAKQLEIAQKTEKQLQKKELQNQREESLKAAQEYAKQEQEAIFGKGKSMSARIAGIKKLAYDKDENYGGVGAVLLNSINILGDLAKQLDSTIETIAGKKSAIDTRLQGSKNSTGGGLFGIGGSYYDAIQSKLTGAMGISPLLKREAVVSKVEELVNRGIAFNIEQRAFLATAQDKIATTFEATNATLLRLVRIQQQDTTAARLGMESALTSFLNNMYETSEYMSNIASSIKADLEESMALMTAQSAIGYEYQVQKWLGSMYSVGMSQSSVSTLGSALGQLSAGDLSGLTSGGVSNLLIMAANRANLSLGDILAKGLDESATNDLLKAAVEYLKELRDDTAESRVVSQEIAKVFGMKASDLVAAANLKISGSDNTLNNIYNNYLGYDQALGQLATMASSMGSRTSMGEMMSNAWSNFKYTMASGIANNPALYALYKGATLLEDLAGGIALPFINVWGFGVDLNTTVSQLMRVAALAGSAISGIGEMISAGGGGGITGSGMLKALNIGQGKISTVMRGAGSGTAATISGTSTSTSGYIGNASGQDVQNKTMNEADEEIQATGAEAEETTDQISNKTINESIISIYNLLSDIASGGAQLHVKVDDYGLTGWN